MFLPQFNGAFRQSPPELFLVKLLSYSCMQVTFQNASCLCRNVIRCDRWDRGIHWGLLRLRKNFR